MEITPEKLEEMLREAFKAGREITCKCSTTYHESVYAADVVRRLVAEQPKPERILYERM